METHQRTQGGPLIYAGDLSAVTDAIINFDANNADPKAAMLASYTFVALTVRSPFFGTCGVPSGLTVGVVPGRGGCFPVL